MKKVQSYWNRAYPLGRRTTLLDHMAAKRRLYFLAAALLAGSALSASAQRAPSATPAPALSPAQKAAPSDKAAADKPMQVSVVRLAQPGCEPNCIEWIAAQGKIDGSTLGEFKRVLAQLGPRKLPILIDSYGGMVDPSLTIGRLVRAKGLDVVVTKTVVTPCEPTDAECRKLKARGILLGKPEARFSKCASSCAFILAGGVRRYVGVWTMVGLHEIKSISTLRLVQRYYRMEPRSPWGAPSEAKKVIVKEKTLHTVTSESPTDEKTYERVTKFFVEMGVHEQIVTILRSTPNSSIRLLKPSELRSTGIATDFIDGEQLLLKPGISTQPPAIGAVVSPGTLVGAQTKPSVEPCKPMAGTTMRCSGTPALANRTAPPAAFPSSPPVAAIPAATPTPVMKAPAPAAVIAAPPPVAPVPTTPITTSSITPVPAAPATATSVTAAPSSAPTAAADAPAAKPAPKPKPKPKTQAARPASEGVERWSPFGAQ